MELKEIESKVSYKEFTPFPCLLLYPKGFPVVPQKLESEIETKKCFDTRKKSLETRMEAECF